MVITMTGEEKQKDASNIPNLRTFETDVANYVKKKGMSLVDLASDQAKFKGLKFQEEKSGGLLSKKVLVLLVLIVILVLGGGFSFLLFGKKNALSPALVSQKPFLIPDKEIQVIIDLNDRQKFLEDIKTALASEAGANELVNILILEQLPGNSKKPVGVKFFFKLTGISPPQELLDSFNDKQFMLSKIYLNNSWPVLIFQVDSYSYAFSGMLKWEKTIANDLTDVFANFIDNQAADVFLDKILQNHDTRVLKDADGNTILAYSFINRRYLAITGSDEPLKEILYRFTLP